MTLADIITITAITFVGIIIFCYFYFSTYKNYAKEGKEGSVLKYHIAYPILLLIATLVFAGILVGGAVVNKRAGQTLASLNADDWYALVFLYLLTIALGVLTVYFFRFSIILNEAGITKRQFWGRNLLISWRDIQSLEFSPKRKIYKVISDEGKVIKISGELRGLRDFHALLAKYGSQNPNLTGFIESISNGSINLGLRSVFFDNYRH